MADCTDNRNRAGSDRPHDIRVVEREEVLKAPAPPRHYDHIYEAGNPFYCPGDLPVSLLPLHRSGGDDDLQREPPRHNIPDIVDDRSGLRCDNTNPCRKCRQRALSFCSKEPLFRKLLFPLFDKEVFLPETCFFHGLYLELVNPVRRINNNGPGNDDLHSFIRIEREPVRVRLPHHTFYNSGSMSPAFL